MGSMIKYAKAIPAKKNISARGIISRLETLEEGLIAGAKNRYASKDRYGTAEAKPHNKATFMTAPIFSVISIAVKVSRPPGSGLAKNCKIGLIKEKANNDSKITAPIERKICPRRESRCGSKELGCSTTVPSASPNGLFSDWLVSVKNTFSLINGWVINLINHRHNEYIPRKGAEIILQMKCDTFFIFMRQLFAHYVF